MFEMVHRYYYISTKTHDPIVPSYRCTIRITCNEYRWDVGIYIYIYEKRTLDHYIYLTDTGQRQGLNYTRDTLYINLHIIEIYLNIV